MPQITRSARRWAALSLCLMSFAATHASASVTLLGNRVIYPAEARENAAVHQRRRHPGADADLARHQ
ncbi:hypothetical protein M8494_14210 [Serratia ureilytica]